VPHGGESEGLHLPPVPEALTAPASDIRQLGKQVQPSLELQGASSDRVVCRIVVYVFQGVLMLSAMLASIFPSWPGTRPSLYIATQGVAGIVVGGRASVYDLP
jgi:hypothetical protein